MFPILYNAHHSLHLEDLPFWLELAKARHGPLLELGCGTGRVLIPLVRAGHQVVGLDHDMGMLRVLQQQMANNPCSNWSVFQADFTSFHLAGLFNLILLPCNTFSTLNSSQRHRLLNCVRAHLHSGGVFVAGIPNPDLLLSLPRRSSSEIEEFFPHPLDKEPVQVSSEWRRDADHFKLYWHYDHLLPQGQVERFTAEVIHHLISLKEIQAEIHSAGFSSLQMRGDFDDSDYTTDSPELILLATG